MSSLLLLQLALREYAEAYSEASQTLELFAKEI